MSNYIPYGIAAFFLYKYVSKKTPIAPATDRILTGAGMPGSYDMQNADHSRSHDATGPKPTKKIAGASLPPEYYEMVAMRGATRPLGYPSTNLNGVGKAREIGPIEETESAAQALPIEMDTAHEVADTAYPFLPSDAMHQIQSSNQGTY
jgi:hypothetical protein